ncbi:MAG: ATP cone domain-containing protein [Candidatus Woykebacteria bacterium]
MAHIVKRKGHKQEYDDRKVYASVYAACLNVHMKDQEAEGIADKVSKDINQWLKDKSEVDYREIFEQVTKSLSKYNGDASFMYKTHLDVS